ncbi:MULTISPECIES: type 2 lanthipeptide synthetase LanM family protein [unclassified Nodularia (in: cyanobacteria)]|uniref:type 2 lanthipeptide synthetase LanM family protein n=1 Tax=unclassified Nodularia (in: cyanobacteria) TaxID=2656917 RepID=UPI001881E7EA|nr:MULTISPECIES: type 2 lanthipeptide synthetase LanM family protein [unclassified Nodularia (in: cyanobacteria)]MBE9199441.1 type 2 lantipeptide synthetase LanM family protein [Nodularia sp. LEGE 06071]MCC2692939.1 type 2 lantipeptide synthetase LanM family protein [Nodularia sp. LEGE 04288]
MSNIQTIQTLESEEIKVNSDNTINQPITLCSAWYQAINLSERITSLSLIPKDLSSRKINAEFAERHVQRWKSLPPFSTDSYFAQRLAINGITEAEFIDLLGESMEAVRDRYPNPPKWLTDTTLAFSGHLPRHNPENQNFLDAIAPLILQGCDRLRAGIASLIETQSHLPFVPSTIVEVLWQNLPEKLLGMLTPTMVLELNVARLQGNLPGETSAARFHSFLEHLSQPENTLNLLQEYPVLARQLATAIEQWVTFSLEFLQHLCSDWETIQNTFSPDNDPGLLIGLDMSVGDRHKGGRSVAIAQFSSGLQLIYKPKSLAVDIHFQELLLWLNQHSDLPPFRTLKVVDQSTYGWVEFAQVQNCSNSVEVTRFYERIGGYLALLYVLEARDFHFENLIASGEHPILIDLEALFHPRIDESEHNKVNQYANSIMYDSVLRVGLLPNRVWSNPESGGIDVSGLGTIGKQLTPDRLPYWEGVGTDEMQLKRRQMEMVGEQHRPTLNGAEINAFDYTESVITGFSKIYQLLLQHREQLLAEDSLLSRFANDEVRVILRPTRTYGLLLMESFHPDLLRNALDRDCYFDRLWMDVKNQPELARIIAAEQEDLHNGDIPIFVTRPHSLDLWSSNNVCIPNFLTEASGMVVRRSLEQLNETDLKQQLWYIRASLSTLATDVERVEPTNYFSTKPQTAANREQLLAAARVIGDRLEELALPDKGNVTWIGLTPTLTSQLSLIPLGLDLYGGVAGVALFLAYLGDVTKEERYTQLAESAVKTLQKQTKLGKSFLKFVGGFSGWGGVIYTLTHLSVLWSQPELLTEAESLLEILPSAIAQDEQLDIIGGSAGCILSLVNLYHSHPCESIIQIARQCGERLLTQAKSMAEGIGWVVHHAGTKPLAGFSHGAAGIALALLELAAFTGDTRFRTAALDAIAYERTLFDIPEGNWLDQRDVESPGQAVNDHAFMTAWCHGAPGIGLARLRGLPHLDNDKIRAEINTALKNTLAQGFGSNHSLCHGDLGNLELLLQASLTLDDPQWKTEVDRLAAVILESIDQQGWLCGVPLGVETPGLMTGLAGIGYGLLRLAAPQDVPSVLSLEPPHLNSQV